MTGKHASQKAYWANLRALRTQERPVNLASAPVDGGDNRISVASLPARVDTDPAPAKRRRRVRSSLTAFGSVCNGKACYPDGNCAAFVSMSALFAMQYCAGIWTDVFWQCYCSLFSRLLLCSGSCCKRGREEAAD